MWNEGDRFVTVTNCTAFRIVLDRVHKGSGIYTERWERDKMILLSAGAEGEITGTLEDMPNDILGALDGDDYVLAIPLSAIYPV